MLKSTQVINSPLSPIILPGQCSAISAPAGYGKTHWLKALRQSIIYLDCHLLPNACDQALFELVLREYLSQASTPTLEVSYRELCSPSATPFSISRAFQVALDDIFKAPQQKLVLAFDHAEEVLEKIPGSVLRQLAALYRRFSGNLTYFFAIRLPLPFYLENRSDFEEALPFLELFPQGNLRHLPLPTSVERLAAFNLPLAPKPLAEIFILAGGHPGLTRLCARLFSEGQTPTLASPEVALECRKLWNSLHHTEQDALVHRTDQPQHPYPGNLRDRGLINSSGEIFSPLFAEFIPTTQKIFTELKEPTRSVAETPLQGTSQPHISYDPYREEVWLEGGRRKVTLVGNSATLFKYLYLRQAKPCCTREELITAVWGNGGYSNENLDRLVSDLRGDIGDTEKQIIRTIPRRGLLMVGVREAVGVRT